MSKHIVTVNRGDVEWEAEIGWSGSYSSAGRHAPEEQPEPYIKFAWRNGAALSNPNLLPDDVEKEILDLASEPTAADFDEFERDEAADAVERFIDKLLEG